jgi:hypothetical protein
MFNSAYDIGFFLSLMTNGQEEKTAQVTSEDTTIAVKADL